MKNIHILPTDKPSRLYKDDNQVLTLNTHPVLKGIFTNGIGSNQHIYITSDEEIKVGDYIIELDGNEVFRSKGVMGKNNWCKKVILTTDQSLDGVQAISDEFLELFVKNLNCESIEVCKNPFYEESNYEHYKIIIPQEEPKQSNNFYEELKHYFETTPREKVLKDWNESVELDKIGPTVEEFLGMIQETLEEAAERIYDDNLFEYQKYRYGFIEGAKWQADRMYSEEEVLIILDKFLTSMIKGEKTGLLEEWFEQFKKK